MNETFERFLLGLVIVSGLTSLCFLFGAAGYKVTMWGLKLLQVTNMQLLVLYVFGVSVILLAIFIVGLGMIDVGDYFEDKITERYVSR